jgi:3-oxoadipate enol-lactonase / 4-carboxymuconolactone decarboxylase
MPRLRRRTIADATFRRRTLPERQLPNGVRLHWLESGDPTKPAIVWIHGGSVEDASFMTADLEPFLGRVRAIFPDARGHGRSQRFERAADYTYPRKAEDLLLLLDALGVEGAVWGGASMGAALSLWVAAHHPARVRAVVSISGPPFAPLPSERRWWAAHRPLVEAGRLDEFLDANIRLRLGDAALDRLKARPERHAEIVGQLARHSGPSLLALLDETYQRTDWVEACARIACPALIVAGGDDRFPTVAMSRRVAATIPGARLHVVAGGSHFPNRTHRAEVLAVLEEFFTAVGL